MGVPHFLRSLQGAGADADHAAGGLTRIFISEQNSVAFWPYFPQHNIPMRNYTLPIIIERDAEGFYVSCHPSRAVTARETPMTRL